MKHFLLAIFSLLTLSATAQVVDIEDYSKRLDVAPWASDYPSVNFQMSQLAYHGYCTEMTYMAMNFVAMRVQAFILQKMDMEEVGDIKVTTAGNIQTNTWKFKKSSGGAGKFLYLKLTTFKNQYGNWTVKSAELSGYEDYVVDFYISFWPTTIHFDPHKPGVLSYCQLLLDRADIKVQAASRTASISVTNVSYASIPAYEAGLKQAVAQKAQKTKDGSIDVKTGTIDTKKASEKQELAELAKGESYNYNTTTRDRLFAAVAPYAQTPDAIQYINTKIVILIDSSGKVTKVSPIIPRSVIRPSLDTLLQHMVGITVEQMHLKQYGSFPSYFRMHIETDVNSLILSDMGPDKQVGALLQKAVTNAPTDEERNAATLRVPIPGASRQNAAFNQAANKPKPSLMYNPGNMDPIMKKALRKFRPAPTEVFLSIVTFAIDENGNITGYTLGNGSSNLPEGIQSALQADVIGKNVGAYTGTDGKNYPSCKKYSLSAKLDGPFQMMELNGSQSGGNAPTTSAGTKVAGRVRGLAHIGGF